MISASSRVLAAPSYSASEVDEKKSQNLFALFCLNPINGSTHTFRLDKGRVQWLFNGVRWVGIECKKGEFPKIKCQLPPKCQIYSPIITVKLKIDNDQIEILEGDDAELKELIIWVNKRGWNQFKEESFLISLGSFNPSFRDSLPFALQIRLRPSRTATKALTPFEKVPYDIREMIIQKLDLRDLDAIRKTCSWLYSYAQPILKKSIEQRTNNLFALYQFKESVIDLILREDIITGLRHSSSTIYIMKNKTGNLTSFQLSQKNPKDIPSFRIFREDNQLRVSHPNLVPQDLQCCVEWINKLGFTNFKNNPISANTKQFFSDVFIIQKMAIKPA